MKRSEAIQELRNLIYSSSNIDVPNDSYIKEWELAEEILQCIEELGMLPPEMQVQNLDTYRHGYSNEWEKE